ncbi:hypothetical protein ARMSODRAFT_961502 [Armillaria solidipes]|uniref:Uncharacterized protein n=1 Tax=Armillaria solidipes TaxID=1076256 RepID=A0A2H3BQ57_9AGAR|nr:hypothetical protein ARMSODRAFT_961502 [Armillaria solidipes]
MWLQRLEDNDDVVHPFATKLAVPSGLSSSLCAESFSLISPALLSLFFPVPFPFPVLACSCVPVHRGSWVRAPVVFPRFIVPVFALRLCSCSGVLILRPCIVLAFPSHSFSWARAPRPFPGIRASCLTAVFGHVWFLASFSHGVLPVFPFPRVTFACFYTIIALHSVMMSHFDKYNTLRPFHRTVFVSAITLITISSLYARSLTIPRGRKPLYVTLL